MFAPLPSDTRVAHLALTVRPSPSPISTPAHTSSLDYMGLLDMGFAEVAVVAFYSACSRSLQVVYVIGCQ